MLNDDQILSILERIDMFSYTYTLINGSYQIKLSQECIDSLDDILTKNYSLYSYYLVNNVSCVKNSGLNLDKFNKIQGQSTSVGCKGENKKLKIIHTIAKEETKVFRKIHRDILNSIVETLEQDF